MTGTIKIPAKKQRNLLVPLVSTRPGAGRHKDRRRQEKHKNRNEEY